MRWRRCRGRGPWACASWVCALFLARTVACGADAAARPLTLQIHWWPQSQFAGYLVAKEKGYFRAAGLPEVKVVPWHSGDAPAVRLAAGKTDFCTGWLSQMVVARAEGHEVVNIAQIMQQSAVMLVTRRSSGIDKPADMAGRRVGLWGAGLDMLPRAFFKKLGIEPQIVIQSYSISPFLHRAVNVASAMYYNEYHQLLEAGLRPQDLNTFLLADYGLQFPEDGLYCTAATRRARPEQCRALVSASLKGWAYAFEHQAEALKIVMKHCDAVHMPTNRNHQRWMLRAMERFIKHRVGDDPKNWGTLAPDAYQHVGQVMLDQKLIKVIPRFDAFYQPALGGQEAGR